MATDWSSIFYLVPEFGPLIVPKLDFKDISSAGLVCKDWRFFLKRSGDVRAKFALNNKGAKDFQDILHSYEFQEIKNVKWTKKIVDLTKVDLSNDELLLSEGELRGEVIFPIRIKDLKTAFGSLEGRKKLTFQDAATLRQMAEWSSFRSTSVASVQVGIDEDGQGKKRCPVIGEHMAMMSNFF